MCLLQTSKMALSTHQIGGEVISDFAWQLTQTGALTFVSGGFKKPHRFVQLKQAFNGTFEQESKSSICEGRWLHSACSLEENRKIILSGGMSTKSRCNASVVSYDIKKDSWSPLPPLNTARVSHAMCAVKGSLYVFCGIGKRHQELSSIEMLAP